VSARKRDGRRPACALAVVVVCFGAPASVADEDPAGGEIRNDSWTVSESPDDPYVNEGTPFMGERDLYLWLDCTIFGASRARMDFTGSLPTVTFTPAPGVIVETGLPSLELDIGCQSAPFLAGTLTVRDDVGAGGDVCMGPNRRTRQCVLEDWQDHVFVGYSTAGSPCYEHSCELDYVDPLSWGRLKLLYEGLRPLRPGRAPR
jgi:hypothetical protein